MTQSLLNFQNAQPQHVRDRNPDSPGAAQASGQATPYVSFPADRYILGDLMRRSFLRHGPNSWCSVADDLIARFREQRCEAQASHAPSITSSGEALRERGIKRVSSNNKEWMQRCIARFESVFVNDTTFTGENIRLACELHNLHPVHVNAWGALINALVRKGLIKATGIYVTPKDRSSHARKIKQYVRV